MGVSKEEAVRLANEAFIRYYRGEIDAGACYKIVLSSEVRSRLDGWRAPGPWDVLGRPGEVTKGGKDKKTRSERKAIRRKKAEVRDRFVIYRR